MKTTVPLMLLRCSHSGGKDGYNLLSAALACVPLLWWPILEWEISDKRQLCISSKPFGCMSRVIAFKVFIDHHQRAL
ncbi:MULTISPECIES: hypothetical protein [Rhizobium/Agrobacterium group]|uniref:hypothetical protein n=1 Tax=Rhizobium/Agrobacterium group TaxID=227290 RepID=UPI001ADBB53E|nr:MULTISPECIES: hypothetical protein [Rhizobium/Agrobacterium group]MBO9112514.1 hypothetical protein [Agrobacterium sp. S2/73]QXZ76019.1 hypothetical protein J5276_28485 [Agrobacterium sp. S7/73]QYA16970.1 hypothetical protein J5284_33020 [Rhizobium sp. AB2/73]UEQ85457.1 hypothetical protein I8E17_31040 [Rhizobium sp. AB2/73]